MYIPDMFRQVDTAAMQQLIAEQPLATLVMATDDGLEANHIPLYWVDIDADTVVLRGHVAKANPMWRQCAAATDVLVIFAGAQLYMSPNYYATKQIDAKVVPTWNYLTVHLHGDLVAIHDPMEARDVKSVNRSAGGQSASPLASSRCASRACGKADGRDRWFGVSGDLDRGQVEGQPKSAAG